MAMTKERYRGLARDAGHERAGLAEILAAAERLSVGAATPRDFSLLESTGHNDDPDETSDIVVDRKTRNQWTQRAKVWRAMTRPK